MLSDVRERIVPHVMEWRLIQYDVNRDVEIDDKMQLTLPDIQLKYADKVFRLYVKSLHDKAVCRGEESLKLNLLLPEACDSIRNPYKSLDKKLDEILQRSNKQIIYAIIEGVHASKIYDELKNRKAIFQISRLGSGKDTRYFVKAVR